MLGAYRRFYLYSALSIAVLAAAVAITALLSLPLRVLGLGFQQPTSDEVRSTIAFGTAVLLVAAPVGIAHLELIRRSLREPEEATANVRHFYLNLWIFAALVVDLIAAQVLASVTAPGITGDRSVPLAAILVASAVGLIAWRWRTTTPPRRLRWESNASYGAMILALLVGLSQLAGAVNAYAQLAVPEAGPVRAPAFPVGAFLERTAWTGAFAFLGAMTIWSVAAAWQWRRQVLPIRLRYLVTFLAAGVLLLGIFLDLELVALGRWLLGHATPRDAVAWLGQLAVGLVLVALHAPLLLRDRGRNGWPPDVVDRLLVAPLALVGLGLLVAGAVQAWTFVVDHVLGLAVLVDEPLPHATAAAVSLALGAATYPVAWRALVRASDPASAVRRFVLFTVICLSLLGTVASASATLFNAISLALGTSRQGHVVHELAMWAFPAVLAVALFGAHLALFLRDRRAAPAEAPADPLLDTLEAVARGELTPRDAAGRIRAS